MKSANDQWLAIPEEFRAQLIQNVWCGKCKDAVTIRDYTTHNDLYGIYLEGKCATCGADVVRVIEDESKLMGNRPVKSEPMTTPRIMDVWNELFEEANKFNKLQCWIWMDGGDLFAVQNPDSGEIGYCSVMGALGEVFGMAVYLGEEGLESMRKIQSDDLPPEEVMYTQKCLLISFEDRAELDKKDLALIKQSGLKFRGANAWPQFRYHEPGYFPWYLNEEQARFATLVLQQAADVAARYRMDRRLLMPPNKDEILVRIPSVPSIGGEIQWSDQWVKPKAYVQHEPKTAMNDQLLLKRVKNKAIPKRGAWEVDYFYAPMPVEGPDKPFYPRMCMWVDSESGQILNFHMAQNGDYRQEFLSKFLQMIESMNIKPHKLFVKRSDVRNCFESTARIIDVRIEQDSSLPNLDEAKESMFDHLL
jgi:hypothetical protein